MKKSLLSLLFVFSVLFQSCTTQDLGKATPAATQDASSVQKFDLSRTIPVDPKVLEAKLENGLTYIIRENTLPEKRAEFRLVVKAGAILEDEDQLGLAHFVEHMAFDGTKNFARQAITNYLESVGMRFGPDLNGYTAYDETVYNLQIPTEKDEVIEKAVMILSDWAFSITFDPKDIEKERSVILEEYRLRRTASSRIFEKQSGVMFNKSRYADRTPIGKPEIIQSFKLETLKRFYRDWYRPDLITVIAVGDFDKKAVEDLIKKHFGGFKKDENAREKPSYPVPDHDETLYSIAQDKEATQTVINILHNYAVPSTDKFGDYRKSLRDNLFSAMLNNRLDETAKAKNPPFLGAYAGDVRYVATKNSFVLGGQVQETGVIRGFQALLSEAERVARYGFIKSEFERSRGEMLVSIKQVYNEREKTESGQYVEEYIRHVTDGESTPGIELEYEMYQAFLPSITLDEVNAVAKTKFAPTNRAVTLSAPEKKELTLPGQDELAALLNDAGRMIVEPYMDNVSKEDLLPAAPKASRVVKENRIADLDLTEWTLANGIRIILKPTQFKNDEIIFSSFSPGGVSLAPDKDLISAMTAAGVITESGVGNFSSTELAKLLSASTARVSPWIDTLFEGINGSSSPADLETALKLVTLYFTAPRQDSDAFETYKGKLEAQLLNKASSPSNYFWDSIQVLLSKDNLRGRPLTYDRLKEMDYKTAYGFYKDRFSDASDFTFVFVGNFTLDAIKPLLETYLGGLPATQRKESFKDNGITTPENIVEKDFKKGKENKSEIVIVFSGTYQYSLETIISFKYLQEILDIDMREKTREEEGGIYSSWVYFAPSRLPREEYKVYFDLSCEPGKVDGLTKTTFAHKFEDLKTKGVAATDFSKAREILLKERQTEIKTNEFWRDILNSYYMQNNDLSLINRYMKTVETMTPEKVQETAKKFLDMKRYVKAVLYPEEQK